jgi:hypothetical protein
MTVFWIIISPCYFEAVKRVRDIGIKNNHLSNDQPSSDTISPPLEKRA